MHFGLSLSDPPTGSAYPVQGAHNRLIDEPEGVRPGRGSELDSIPGFHQIRD